MLARHSRYAAQLFEASQQVVDFAKGAPLGVFGLSAAALIAGCYSDLSLDKILAFFDENPFFWGKIREGKPIYPLESLKDLNIRHVFLSANPVYIFQMKEKLQSIVGTKCLIFHA